MSKTLKQMYQEQSRRYWKIITARRELEVMEHEYQTQQNDIDWAAAMDSESASRKRLTTKNLLVAR